MNFISFVNLDVVQKSEKAWCTCTFLNHFREVSNNSVSNNYAPWFNRIDFVVIPLYIELTWLRQKAYLV